MGRSDTAAAVAADLEPKDLESLACEVWELWIKAGAQSKTKWVLSFAAVFGGAAMTPKLIHAVNDWPQNARGAIACDAVAALAVSPDPAALVAVDSISRKFKFRQVKAAAAAALESAAQGWASRRRNWQTASYLLWNFLLTVPASLITAPGSSPSA